MFPEGDVFPQPSYHQALESLVDGTADYALLPAYNTRTGALPDSLALIAQSGFHVVGEVWRPIRLRIHAARSWVKAHRPDFDTLEGPSRAVAAAGLIHMITEISSDLAGFNQYHALLKRLMPRAERRVTGCTAEAARIVHQQARSAAKPEQIPAHAALTSDEAAEMYDLVALNRPEQTAADADDEADNHTLYYVLGRKTLLNTPGEKRLWLGFARLLGQERIRRTVEPGDLAVLFCDEGLARRLDERMARLGLDAARYPDEAERERANVLFDALAGLDGPRLANLYAIARALDAPRDLLKRVREIEKHAGDFHRELNAWQNHAEKPEKNDAIRGAKDIKTVVLIRTRGNDRDGQAALHQFVGVGAGDVRVRLLCTLPDGANGHLLIAELDGFLVGFDAKQHGGFARLGRNSAPARLLARVAREAAEIQILGSFPRAAEPPRPRGRTDAGIQVALAPSRFGRVAGVAGLGMAAGAAAYFAGALLGLWGESVSLMFALGG